MKQFVAILLLFLTVEKVVGQGTPCGFDLLRKNHPRQYAFEDFFYDGLNQWRLNGQIPREYPNPEVLVPCDYCLQTNPALTQAKFVIPIVVHVVHLPNDSIIGTESNISLAQIQNQIEQLNLHFTNTNGGPKSVNTGIQFCLAPVGPGNSGVIRYSSSKSNHYIADYNDFIALNTSLSQDKYLHIFTCNNIITDTAVKGYSSTFGDKYQGVVVEYKRFGKYVSGNSSINVVSSSRGKVLAHEIGHYLGLLHTFEGGCGDSTSPCDKQGDKCCDTPPVNLPNSDCNSTKNSCRESYNGDLADQTENYMDYAGEDCQNTFTRNQTEIMHYMLLKKRTALVDPIHINSLNLACASFSAFFKPASNTICQNDTVKFTALYYSDTAHYSWKIKHSGSTYHTASGKNLYSIKVKLTGVGVYETILTVTKGSNSVSDTVIDAVLAQNCNTPKASTQGNWYFGKYAGLRFTSTNQVVISDKALNATPNPTINRDEGCITQSALDGRLLFYGGGWAELDANGDALSDSFYVYDKTHRLMPNGVLKGSSSSMQGGIIVPHPENGAKYYLLTTNELSARPIYNKYNWGTRWSIIDTSLNNGKGDVMTTYKNKPLKVPIGIDSINNYDSAVRTGEGITAVSHCDGKRYWIISGSARSNTNSVHVFLSDTNGIFYHHTDTMPYKVNYLVNSINASRDGNFICVSRYLFRFNRTNGSLTYLKAMADTMPSLIYSEFSPNSSIIYNIAVVNDSLPFLLQTDLSSSNLKTTALPLKSINRMLQLGPDNKIYLAQYDEGYLSVIEHPDSLNNLGKPNACGFQQDYLSLNPNGTTMLSKIGLPNMIDAISPSDAGSDFKFQIKNCQTYVFRPIIDCSVFYIWDFGDGDTAHGFWSEHTYLSSGTYTVTLMTDYDTITKVIKVGFNVTKPSISGSHIICDTSLIKNYSITNYKPDSISSYKWIAYKGNLLGRNGISNMDVKWYDEGKLTLVYENRFGCVDSVWVIVTFADSVISNNVITKLDNYFCDSAEQVTITGTLPNGGAGNYKFYWYTRTSISDPWFLLIGEYNDTLFTAISSRYYYRLVVSEGCEHISNTIAPSTPYITGNTINVSRVYCTSQTITGSNMGSKIKYFWRIKKSNTTVWTDYLSDRTQNYTPIDDGYIYDYARVAYLDSVACYNQSNAVRIIPFSRVNAQIGPNTSPCGIVSIGSDLDSITGVRYIWQRSSDSITWTNLNNDTLKSINHNTSLSNFFFYRRKAYLSSSCFAFSNVVYTNGIKVRIPLKDMYVCYGGSSTDTFRFVLYNDKDTSLRFKWEIRYPPSVPIPNPAWIGTSETQRYLPANYPYYYGSNTGVRCRIINACDTLYTSAAYVRTMNPLDTITQQPSLNYSISQGSNLNVICKVTRPSDKKYQWQCSHNNGLTWFDVRGQNSDTLKIRNANRCQHKKTYRLKAVNFCDNVTFSDTTNITVTSLSSITQDYWMRDQWSDNGTEPNNSNYVVLSPDIFLLPKIYTSRPKSIKYLPSGDAPNNYVHAMIQNRGIDSAKGGHLYLYWTVGATGEKWPLNWTHKRSGWINYHFNSDSMLNSDIGHFPLGGQINSEPILIPNLKKGDSVLLSYRWDRLPKAEWYKGLSRDKNRGVNICLLARIQTCEETAFGMTYPEVTNVKINVAKNNNIVTRNLWINFMSKINGNNGGGGTGQIPDDNNPSEVIVYVGKDRPIINGGHTLFRNVTDETTSQKLCIKTSNSSYYSKAEAFIALDSSLYVKWVAGGSNLSGLTSLGNGVFKITSATACLTNISADSGFVSGFTPYFVYLDKNDRFNNEESFLITVDQRDNSDFIEGSVAYKLMDNPFVPEILTIDSIMTACDWDMSGGTVRYTVSDTSLPYTIFDEENHQFIVKNETGIYTLTPGDYTLKTLDEVNDILTRINLTVNSAMITNLNNTDTVWYNCDYPDSVDYVKSCENGVMYDRFDQVVNESSAGHFTLDPQEPYYTFACADSTNCIKYSAQIKFMDIIQIPASTSNNLTGMYNREENPCCFIDLTEAECDGETPLTFGQEIQVYDMNADFLYQTNLELYGGTVLGFRFCPPQWDTASNVINNWYSIVIRNDECSFCRMDFMCDSISDPEPFVILNYPSGKPMDNLGLFEGKSANKGTVASPVKPQKLPPSISIYPNPTQSEVNVKIVSVNSANITLNITDMAGKSVYKNSYKTTNNQLTTSINLSELVSGIYTVYVPELNYYYKLVIIK